MNVNANLINILSEATGLPVEPDEYNGKSDKYIVFAYTDERPEAFGDNKPIADTVYVQIQLITPKKYNYLSMKKIIRDTLENNEYIVTSIRSFLGDEFYGTEKIRQTIFECSFSMSRKEN